MGESPPPGTVTSPDMMEPSAVLSAFLYTQGASTWEQRTDAREGGGGGGKVHVSDNVRRIDHGSRQDMRKRRVGEGCRRGGGEGKLAVATVAA
jgi:hypothetical protein